MDKEKVFCGDCDYGEFTKETDRYGDCFFPYKKNNRPIVSCGSTCKFGVLKEIDTNSCENCTSRTCSGCEDQYEK